MSTKVAVVVPNHKAELNPIEKISLAQCRKVLSRYPLIHAVPEGQNFAYFEPGEHVAEFPAQYFQSLKGYNVLSVSPKFYKPFADFDYILIYQLDAFIFYDALEEFCALGYDYIGAAWPRYVWSDARVDGKTPQVGNSGFCLRKVKACRKLAEQTNIPPNWSIHVAPVEAAALFSMEWHPARHVKRFGLPFGCHGWTIFGADFYVELFARFGYDLQPFRVQMGNKDRDCWRRFRVDFAMRRLIRDARRGRSMLGCLPTKRFASIRVIRSEGTSEVLARLLAEKPSLSKKISVVEKDDWPALLRDMKRETLPHLLLTFYDDEDLLKLFAEERGFVYGKHIISFRREYMKRCAQILRTFGRRT